MVVYGYEATESDTGDPGEVSEPAPGGSLHCYMTVTAVPSLHNCQACVKVNKTVSCRNNSISPGSRLPTVTMLMTWLLPGTLVLDSLV